MLNLIRAEIFKLSKSTAFKVCFLLCSASAIALVFISNGIAVGRFSNSISGNASGLTEICIISLLGSLMAGVLISSDFETKTIHSSITAGAGRRAIVMSKVFVFSILIPLLMLPYALASIIGLFTGAEFTAPFVPSVFIGFLYDASKLDLSADVIGKIIIISIVTMLVHAARIAICIPVAIVIRKPAVILAFGFVFNGLISLVISLLADVPVVSDLIQFTPFSADYLLMTLKSNAGTLMIAALSSIVFLILIAEGTYRIFRKAEIK